MMVGGRVIKEHPLMRRPAELKEIGLIEPHVRLARGETKPISEAEKQAEESAMILFKSIKRRIETRKNRLTADSDLDEAIRVSFALYLCETIEQMYTIVIQKNELGLFAAFKTARSQVETLLNDKDYFTMDIVTLVGGFARNDEVFQACLVLCDIERVQYSTAILSIMERMA